MVSALALLPILILLLIAVGSGAVGLVFIALFNIGLTFGTYMASSSTTDWQVVIPAEDSND